MSRLDELQHEFMERHKDADMVECWLPPPEGNGKVKCAIYYSPEYKSLESARAFFRETLKRTE